MSIRSFSFFGLFLIVLSSVNPLQINGAQAKESLEQVFNKKAEVLEKRAKDYIERKKNNKKYEAQVRSFLQDYKDEKESSAKSYEKYRIKYSQKKAKERSQFSRKKYEKLEAQSLKEIEEREQNYIKLQKGYVDRERALKRMLKKKRHLIPEDEELGLDYDKI